MLNGLLCSLSNVTEHKLKAEEFSKSRVLATEAYFVKLLLLVCKSVSSTRAGVLAVLFSAVSSVLAHSKCPVSTTNAKVLINSF